MDAGRPSEADLVRRARGGDVAAFEALYRAHAGRVYAVCLRLAADPARAEDLTQDTFVRAWEKLPSFRGESGFGSWLHRLALNLALSHLRSRGRWRTRLVAEDPPHEHPAPASMPAAALDLERALSTLPPKARAVVVLHDVEGYRHHEIAALTGIAEGTSKAQLHRARRLLRKVLQP